jgi:LuxR family maltose regulon positive regulatory protein
LLPAATTSAGGSLQAPLLDPLSDRELEVLRLLNTAMSGPEIARELFVSPNTLRTHTKHIFSKLEVNSRRAAVHRAGELGLI